MYLLLQFIVDPFDGKSYVLSWTIIKDNPVDLTPEHFHIKDVPPDFFHGSEYWYVRDNVLRKNQYRRFE